MIEFEHDGSRTAVRFVGDLELIRRELTAAMVIYAQQMAAIKGGSEAGYIDGLARVAMADLYP